jgi:predicted amidophosphoribosyltransferase
MSGAGVSIGAGAAIGNIMEESLRGNASIQNHAESNTVECPHCHLQVASNHKFCNSCGKPITTPKNKCNKCGAEVGSNAKFCPECGEPQNLEKFCSNCRAKMGPNAKFCPECGKANE